MSKKDDVEFTNHYTGEKFIHKENPDGSSTLFYGPKDTSTEKKHGHAEFDKNGNVIFNRNPKDE